MAIYNLSDYPLEALRELRDDLTPDVRTSGELVNGLLEQVQRELNRRALERVEHRREVSS